jgi:DNA-binding NtrC family response regulator
LENTRTILIVDDENDLLEMYKELFEFEGFKVLTAASANEAIKIYRDNSLIDLIISDSNMGAVSGLDFLKMLKDNNNEIPPFYLATGAFDYTEIEIQKRGASRLILKPFDIDDILEKIKLDLKIK